MKQTLWEHVSIIAAAVGAIAFGAFDIYHGQHLTAAGDVALISSGFATLGIKGVFGASG